MNRSDTGVIPEIDVPILAQLPKMGTNVGLKPVGATAKFLTSKNPQWEMTTAEIAGRLKSMRDAGYIVSVSLIPRARGVGYQITPEGETFLKEVKQ